MIFFIVITCVLILQGEIRCLSVVFGGRSSGQLLIFFIIITFVFVHVVILQGEIRR